MRKNRKSLAWICVLSLALSVLSPAGLISAEEAAESYASTDLLEEISQENASVMAADDALADMEMLDWSENILSDNEADPEGSPEDLTDETALSLENLDTQELFDEEEFLEEAAQESAASDLPDGIDPDEDLDGGIAEEEIMSEADSPEEIDEIVSELAIDGDYDDDDEDDEGDGEPVFVFDITSAGTCSLCYVDLDDTDVTDIVIPSTYTEDGTVYNVTKIDDGALGYQYSITSVTIPSTVAEIGKFAFSGCYRMTKVTVQGSSLRTIGDGAFQWCSNLTSFNIPSGVTTIGKNAFNGTGLTSVVVPTSVTTIQYGAFAHCTNLTKVDFASGSKLTEIQTWAFHNTKLSSVTFPASLTTVSQQAFTETRNLKNVYFTGKVTSIKSCAFGYIYEKGDVRKGSGMTLTGMIASDCYRYAKENGLSFIPTDPYLTLNVTGLTIPIQVKKSYTPTITNIFETDTIAKWTSSNSAVAKVDSAGRVTGVKKGNAVITATTKYGASTSFKVKIQKGKVTAKRIKNLPKNLKLKAGETRALNPVIQPFSAKEKIRYKTSDKKVARVKNNTVYARKKGKATITVKAGKATFKIKVTVTK